MKGKTMMVVPLTKLRSFTAEQRRRLTFAHLPAHGTNCVTLYRLVGPYPHTMRPARDGLYLVVDTADGWHNLYQYNVSSDEWRIPHGSKRLSTVMCDARHGVYPDLVWYGTTAPGATTTFTTSTTT
jgi:hypothetical protein